MITCRLILRLLSCISVSENYRNLTNRQGLGNLSYKYDISDLSPIIQIVRLKPQTRSMKTPRVQRRSKQNHGFSSTVKSLPKELLLDVFSRVASESFTDLYKLKIICKDFLDVAEDNYIYQIVSLDKFPLVPWYNKESLFLKYCKENGNLEGLYRGGMLEYFKEFKENSGLESLKRASEQGHKEARYAYGMILLCSEDEEMRKQGMEQLRFLKMAKCVKRCGKNVRRFIKIMWVKKNIVVPNGMSLRHSKTTCNGRSRRDKRGWPLLNDEDYDDDEECEGCMWDHELTLFSNMFQARVR